MGEHLEIVEYDLNWPRKFESERMRIAGTLGDLALRIDHNGSTAVPGLAAKPIIDIQVSVGQLHPIETYASRLARLGYQHVPHPDDYNMPYFHRPRDWPHTYHIHVVQAQGEEERRTLAFRDYLRDHGSVAREYEDLKRSLAPHFNATSSSSRQAYSDSKSEFINRIVQRALEKGYPRDLKRTV